jgi:3-methyladenine DNA glycosylase/8-oxoguanine DNA glycosylase
MNPTYRKARKHLSSEPIFKRLIDQIGRCTLQPNPDAFSILAHSIVSQQISGKAAASISGRLVAQCGRKGLKPKRVAELTDEEIRTCGLSANKLLSLRSLSDRMLRGNLDDLSDEQIHEHLIPIRGIGPWTVQMFLIFSLGRLDVFPTLDLGVRNAMQKHFENEEMPVAEMIERAEAWRPYRTVATWYLWRSLGPVPQSE